MTPLCGTKGNARLLPVGIGGTLLPDFRVLESRTQRSRVSAGADATILKVGEVQLPAKSSGETSHPSWMTRGATS